MERCRAGRAQESEQAEGRTSCGNQAGQEAGGQRRWQLQAEQP